jgi:hypothetical protein
MQGVFETLIGRRSFIHRIELSISKPISLKRLTKLRATGSKGCLGPKSFYSRFVWGRFSGTGNRFYLWYGKASRFPRVPLARLILISDGKPLTLAEVLAGVIELIDEISAVRVTKVEFTFDLHQDQVVLAKSVFSIAQKRKELTDNRGWRTNYVGAPGSERQIRIYRKTDDVARVELVLHRASLSRLGIRSPQQIVRLRKTDFRRFMHFRDFDTVAFRREIGRRVAPAWRRRIWHEYLVRLSAQEQTREFEASTGVAGTTFTRPSSINHEIGRMQRRLVW